MILSKFRHLHAYTLTLFLFLVNCLISFSQPVNNYTKDVSMPAPNAAALGKFGDYTVGNFTGVPDISIPIYTVQDGPLSLPIGLSYHASGLKVAEMASWVGAGWSLNCGGIITRTVQDKRDDAGNGYWYTATQLETKINDALNYNGTVEQKIQASYGVTNDIMSGAYDGEPDLFSFNVGGYSGKFYIDRDHNAQFIPKQDLKLQITGVLDGFTLIAPDGTRYIFGSDGTNKVQEITHPTLNTTDDFISSWYLMKIETPDKKYNLTLSYADEAYSYLSPASIKYTVVFNQTANCINWADYDASSISGDVTHRVRRTYMSGKKLVKIKSSTDEVNFISNTVRTDLDDQNGSATSNTTTNGANALDKITINTGGKCQEFDFAYSYFQDQSSFVPNIYPQSYAQKLRLNSLTQKNCVGTISNPPYLFTYQGNFSAHRLSKAIDHWGFNNGVTSNESHILNIPNTPSGNPQFPSYGLESPSDRETNETEMIKGVIQDITFPTGGKTTFTFEANTINKLINSPDLSVFKIVNFDCSNPANSACCATLTTRQTRTLTTEDLTSGKFILSLTKTFINGSNNSLCTGANPNATINIYDNAISSTTNPVASLSVSLDANNSAQTFTSVTKLMTYFGTLVAGKFCTFELVQTNGYATFELFNSPLVNINKQIGGLRVKQIVTTDGVSTANDIVKQYDYSYKDSPGYSSGKLLRQPTYFVDVASQQSANRGLIAGGMIFWNDESTVPLYTFEGNHIGYQYVKEIQTGNSQNIVGNGTKQYQFEINYPQVAGSSNFNSYPLPPLDPVVTNGQVKVLTISSNSAVVLKETTNQIYPENPTFSIGKIRKVVPLNFPVHIAPGSPAGNGCPTSSTIPFYFSYTDYQIRTLPYRLASVTETMDNVPVTTTYTYSTDPTQPLFPLTTTITNSDGKQTVTINKYITHVDYSTGNTVGTDAGLVAAATSMKAFNIISNPIEVTTSVNGVQVNGARTIYNLFDVPSGTPAVPACSTCFPYPYKFYKYKMSWDINGNPQVFGTNNGWDLEGTINAYDPLKAKPTQINLRAWENATQTNATEVYTWDATNGLIKTRTFKGFLWQYEYLPNSRLVSKIIDKDLQFVTYTYDDLLRLTTASARNGNVTTNYTYKYQDVAQSNRNWVETKTTFTSAIGGTLGFNTTYKTMRQYLDGLGRPVQNVAVANGPNLKDVISVVAYDNQGREYLKYDPFESANTDGSFVSGTPTTPVTTTGYEASPLNRTLSVTPPNWIGTFNSYGANTDNEVFDANFVSYPANKLHKMTVTSPDGRVSQEFTDIKGRKLLSKKFQGGVNGVSFTNYQYDDKDRLIKAIQPQNAAEVGNTTDVDFTYLYDYNDNMIRKKVPDAAPVLMQYNYKNQLVLMQDGNQSANGKWLATQYDDYGRPAATGFAVNTALDATTFNPTLSTPLTTTDYSATAGTDLGKPIRTKNYYGTYLESFLQYDNFGRVANTFSNNHFYSPSGAITTTNFSERVAMTYDLADNLLIKTRTHKPDANTTHTIVETVDYDNALRVKQTRHQYDNLQEQVLDSLIYTVKNQVLTKYIGRTSGLTTFLQKEDFTYNNLGWLTGINPNTGGLKGYTNQPLGDCAVPDVNTYTNLDDNDLFSLNLSYDAPNQNFVPSNTPTARGEFGGNITQMVWQVRGRERQVYTLQYDFLNRMTEAHYSELNFSGTRTKDLDNYMEKLTYDARGNILTLQRNGMNAACGVALIDNLTYSYNNYGTNINRLNSVIDAADLTKGFKLKTGQAAGGTYTYDANGNLITDPNKGITSIVYNHLNLPEKITFVDGNIIQWLYDASGTKLKKTTTQVAGAGTTLVLNGVPLANNVFTNGGLITSAGTIPNGGNVTMIGGLGVELQPGFLADQGSTFVAYQAASGTVNTQDYIGGFEYKNGTLEAVYHSEGRITTINGTLKYEYALKDHLGNTRLMFCDKNNDGIITQSTDQEQSEVSQENHYYPFGMAMEGIWSNTLSISDNKYQYNGKELNDDFGLGWMDYGARMYDAAVGRWNGVDPMSEKYGAWSSYQYVKNNPIRLFDINGMYDASATDSKNTWALGQDGGAVGGAGSHEEAAAQPSTVKPTGDNDEKKQASLKMIKNTLRKEDAKYVRLDADGNIDKNYLNSQNSDSENFKSLKEMVNSDMVLEVSLDDKFTYKDANGAIINDQMPIIAADEFSDKDTNGSSLNGTSTGETGFLGKTLIPGNRAVNSPDDIIRVIVNKDLSEAAQAEIYSHEANGHAYIYMTTGDRDRAGHNAPNWKELNTELKTRILQSKQETIKNMHN